MFNTWAGVKVVLQGKPKLVCMTPQLRGSSKVLKSESAPPLTVSINELEKGIMS